MRTSAEEEDAAGGGVVSIGRPSVSLVSRERKPKTHAQSSDRCYVLKQFCSVRRTLGAKDARFFDATVSGQDVRWRRSQDGCSPKTSGLHPLDVRAEFAQFFVEMFVAAIDVINAAHLSNSFGL